MEISKLTFVGTVEEFAAIAHLFGGTARSAPPADEPELIRRVLERKQVPPGQRALLRALYRAGDAGLDAPELARAMDRSEPELAGVLGALGRRINGTPGANTAEPPGITLMLDVTAAGNGWNYRLRDAARAALEANPPPWLAA